MVAGRLPCNIALLYLSSRLCVELQMVDANIKGLGRQFLWFPISFSKSSVILFFMTQQSIFCLDFLARRGNNVAINGSLCDAQYARTSSEMINFFLFI